MTEIKKYYAIILKGMGRTMVVLPERANEDFKDGDKVRVGIQIDEGVPKVKPKPKIEIPTEEEIEEGEPEDEEDMDEDTEEDMDEDTEEDLEEEPEDDKSIPSAKLPTKEEKVKFRKDGVDRMREGKKKQMKIRQKAIVALKREGYTHKEIAQSLNLSLRTVIRLLGES